MPNSIISEGKTTTEAVENGLKILKVSKDKVEIKVLENENKKSFFSILTPRVVKVELTVKENSKKEEKRVESVSKEYNSNISEIEVAKKDVEEFLKQFISKVNNEIIYNIKIEDNTIVVNIDGNSYGNLIGYRGETLNAMQIILSSIANKKVKDRIKLILDIGNYREKRNITLEPMTAFERKIIHSKLQENPRIETYSIGEGDNRRVVIAKK